MNYMANLKRSKNLAKHQEYINLAFSLAEINLGSTKSNPSVGCIIEKNGSIISSGHTSLSGRPHAEFNALNKKIDFKNANLYSTLEPCTHHGKSPPCTNIIKKKGIKNVYYSIDDYDLRTKEKSRKILSAVKIKVIKRLDKKRGLSFYRSYANYHQKSLPLIDAKIAISKDYFSINRKDKWITNYRSRKLTHLLRTRYQAIISTSKSINKDDSLLNCRIDGLNNKSPDLIIIDIYLKLKKNLRIFKDKTKRSIYIFTIKKDKEKINWFRRNNIKVVRLSNMSKKDDYKKILMYMNSKGYYRIFVEAGLTYTNFLIKNKLLDNIFIFKSFYKLRKKGKNNSNIKFIKKIKLKNRLKVFLENDEVYKEKII